MQVDEKTLVETNPNISNPPLKDLVKEYENFLINEGYEQVIHLPIAGNDPLINNAQAITDGIVTKDMLKSPARKLASLLFAKDGKLFSLSINELFKYASDHSQNEMNNSLLKPFPDGVCVLVVALIRNNSGECEMQVRSIPKGEHGHPALLFDEEIRHDSICLLAAGEAFLLNGKVIMTNDKSGNYYASLKQKNMDQKGIFNRIFSPYYADHVRHNGFFYASENDCLIIDELMARGFPYAKLPNGIKKKYPMESLSAPSQQLKLTDEPPSNRKLSLPNGYSLFAQLPQANQAALINCSTQMLKTMRDQTENNFNIPKLV